VVLAEASGQELQWASADRSLLVTRNGRLVKTAGFPQDLKLTRNVGADPLAQPLLIRDRVSAGRRMIDIQPGDFFGAMIDSRFRIVGSETITVVDTQRDCIRIEEDCNVPSMKWSFVNTFWIDQGNGFIWRSRQYYVPNSPPAMMTVGRPYIA
jgi:hypothetical protein